MDIYEEELPAQAVKIEPSFEEGNARQTTLKIADGCDERRNDIARAVLDVVARDGVRGVTISTIAQKTGWSADAVSRDFKDKRALLLAGLRTATEAVARRMMETAEIDDPIDRVFRLLEAGMPLDAERIANCRIFYHFQAEGVADDTLGGDVARNYTAWRAAVRKAIADAQREDHFLAHQASELAETLVALAEGLGIQGMCDPKALPPARLRKRLAQAIEHLAEGSPFG